MKTKATKKSIMAHRHVVLIPYMEAYDLLRAYPPQFYYGSNYYGWYADIRLIMHEGMPVYLVEGYQPFGHKHLTIDDVKPYNDRAGAVWEKIGMEYEDQVKAVDEILHEFIEDRCM